MPCSWVESKTARGTLRHSLGGDCANFCGCSFLGYVDLLGTTYQAPTLASGFGSHMAQPLLREAYEKRQEEGKSGAKEGELMSREEATAVLEDCMKVLYYRDARSLNKVRRFGHKAEW